MLTVQVDNFAACLPELRGSHRLHWDELGLFKDRMVLDPQYDEYARRERDGKLFMVTVRVDGRIAAYYTAQIAPGFHYRNTLTAHMDIAYVLPEFRGRGLIRPLLKRVEQELRRRAVQVWYSGYKDHQTLGMPGVLDLFGFQPADHYHVKWLGN